MDALDRITYISAALLLCACGTYAQQATQAGAGLELLGATVRAGSHSAQTMTSQMFAPRAPRHAPMLTGAPYFAEEVFDRSQTLPTEHTSRKERARYEGISGFGGRTRTEDVGS